MEFSYRKGILLGTSIGLGILIVQILYGFILVLPEKIALIGNEAKELLIPAGKKEWDKCMSEESEKKVDTSGNVSWMMFGEPGESIYEICKSKGYNPYTEEQKSDLLEAKTKTRKNVDMWYRNNTADTIQSNDTCEIYYLREQKLGRNTSYVRDGEIRVLKDNGTNKIIEWNYKYIDNSGKKIRGTAKCYISREKGGSAKVELI